jgi:hypothetical protein
MPGALVGTPTFREPRLSLGASGAEPLDQVELPTPVQPVCSLDPANDTLARSFGDLAEMLEAEPCCL